MAKLLSLTTELGQYELSEQVAKLPTCINHSCMVSCASEQIPVQVSVIFAKAEIQIREAVQRPREG